MCIAIFNHRHDLSIDTIATSWNNNPQGGGLLYVNKNNNKLQSFKTYELKQFYKAYLEILDVAKKGNVILHFRIATQGVKSLDNLHPFMNPDKSLGFVHNGIISEYSRGKHYYSDKSDTAIFNDEVVSKLDGEFIYDKDLQNRMSNFVGRWNKLIFLNEEADATIINEDSGDWFNDQWFSNDSWCSTNKYHGHIKI
jgi:predicted glutamine amidotransferase